jgi:hypothetical protein
MTPLEEGKLIATVERLVIVVDRLTVVVEHLEARQNRWIGAGAALGVGLAVLVGLYDRVLAWFNK